MNKKDFKTLAFTDAEINEELMDALIKAGSHEYIQNSIQEIPDDELSDIEFSKELDKKLREYFDSFDKEQRQTKTKQFIAKTKNVLVRAAAILFVLIVLAVGFVATSEATQLKLFNIYVEHSNIESHFDFNDEDTKNPNKNKIDSMEEMFTYIPYEMELIYEDQGNDTSVLIYESAEGDYLQITKMNEGVMSADTEGARNYEIKINDIVCFISEHEDKSIAVFTINKYSYVITISLDIEELIKIVENIQY